MTDIKAALQTPVGLLVGVLLVVCLGIAAGSLGHQYWLCTTLSGERAEHRDYVETIASAMNAAHVAALNKVDLTVATQTELLKEMRAEQAAREGRIVEAASNIETVAAAIEWRAREFQKAALQFLREQE